MANVMAKALLLMQAAGGVASDLPDHYSERKERAKKEAGADFAAVSGAGE